MNRFCCKHCGMITDNPKIKYLGVFDGDYTYSTTCPVCLGVTQVTRPEPFPTAKTPLDYLPFIDGLDIDLSTIPSRVF